MYRIETGDMWADGSVTCVASPRIVKRTYSVLERGRGRQKGGVVPCEVARSCKLNREIPADQFRQSASPRVRQSTNQAKPCNKILAVVGHLVHEPQIAVASWHSLSLAKALKHDRLRFLPRSDFALMAHCRKNCTRSNLRRKTCLVDSAYLTYCTQSPHQTGFVKGARERVK